MVLPYAPSTLFLAQISLGKFYLPTFPKRLDILEQNSGFCGNLFFNNQIEDHEELEAFKQERKAFQVGEIFLILRDFELGDCCKNIS